MRALTVAIVTPAAPTSRAGNRVTALRWAGLLRELGHRVRLRDTSRPLECACDVLVALHARKSAEHVARSAAEHPARPIVVAMTGTDLYEDLPACEAARRSIALATRVVVLQPRALDALPPDARGRARVILQSARCPLATHAPDARPVDSAADATFDVCVVGHLREVKDPLCAARAARLLPASSRVRVLHVGAALAPSWAAQARAEAVENPRYVWFGERSRLETQRVIAASRALVVTSRLEGGGNVISEALACGVPVLSTRIDGAVGNLGEDYPGYFPPGDAAALAALLARCETDAGFYRALGEACARRRPQVDPARERAAWGALLAEIVPEG